MRTIEPATSARPWSRSRLLNIWVDSLTIPLLMDHVRGLVFTVNPDHLYHLQRNRQFAEVYRKADFVTSDSKYVYWALKFLGRPIAQKLSGSDLVPAFWRHHAADPGTRIFLLGAKEGIADQARRKINAEAGRDIVVGAHGPSMRFVDDPEEIASVIAMINVTAATVLIVGLGAPKQEIWIDRHRADMPTVHTFMGVGATIDYEAGAVRRAPGWMTRNGLEWVYRMTTEPRRYWRRYARDMEFFWLVLLDRLGLYRPPSFDSSADQPSSAPNGARP